MSTESMLRYWSGLSQEERDARGKKHSETLRKYYEELDPEIQKERNRSRSLSISRQISSLSSLEQKERLLKSFHSEASREKSSINNPFNSPEVQKKAAEGRQKYFDSLTVEERVERLNRSFHSEEGKANQKSFFANESEEAKDKRLKSTCLSPEAILKNQGKGPTELELFIGMYLEKNFPGEWAYNGGFNQRVMVGRRIPDFISLRGFKIVVEGFGLYRHDEEDIKSRVRYYEDRGYKCVSLDSFEGYIEDDVVRKVKEAYFAIGGGLSGSLCLN